MIKTFLFLAVVLMAIGLYLTVGAQSGPNQAAFLAGKVPDPRPDGLYKGTAIYTANWQGKKFDAASNTGANLFLGDDGKTQEKFPFVTSVGKGLRDPNTDVLKIDYSAPTNPFWLRWILDEIVEVGPNKYLGKVHVRIIPGLPFTLGYFELTKPE